MKPDNYSSKSTNSVGLKKTLETLPRGWISLSEDELIEAYNCAQSVISRKAIKVSISDLKGRQFSNLGVLLDEQRKGNYCVIVTEKGDSWLLPKVHFRINSFNKDTLKSLFEFNGSFSEDAREFSLVKLAKVSLMPGGDYWQLEKRGELHFGENSQLFQLHSELEGVKQEREKLESELRLARNERDRFASQVAELTYESLKKTYERLEKILAKLEEGDRWQSNLTECLERLEQVGSFQEKRFSNLEVEFQRLAQLKPELSEKLSQLQSQLSKLEKSEINNIYQLQELTQKQNNNIAFLEAEREKINQINNEISKIKEELQQQLKDELRPIKELIGLFGEWFKNNPEYLPLTTTIDPQVKLQTSTELNTTREVEEEGKYQLPLSEEEQLLKDYKDEKKRVILSQNAITVSAATESIDNSRLGIGKSVLEKKRRGNYWILKQGGSQYLVPSDTIKINEYSIDTLKKLFECQGVNSEGSKGKFELLKPAKVSSIGEEKWQLSEPGKLEFIG